LPAFHQADLLSVMARDPKSLFVYWDLNWTRLFAEAALSARPVHLRIHREDGAIEDTLEINPFRGHCYAEVAAPGTEYQCELGCFDGDEWTTLAWAERAATPMDSRSEDMSAQFATLPLHLSFQRMLDIFRPTKTDAATLARSVAELQESARATDGGRAAVSLSSNGASLGEFAALLRPPFEATPTAGELARWKQLGEQFGGSSWGEASRNSPA
jgi:hypothetical protein